MFTLAHLTDVHLAPLPRVRLGELAGKRLIGFQSWLFRRRYIHQRAIADAVRDDIRAASVDHIALTGDLINISAAAEYAPALAWLESLGPPDRVSFVPGNHDAYVATPWDKSLGQWAAYMAGDLKLADAAEPRPGLFPYVRQRRNVALIGLSSALPQPVGYATGRLGDRQIAAAAAILRELRKRGFCRVVLIHHPPAPGLTAPRKELLDARDFAAMLQEEGAELVLFGHTHLDHRLELSSRTGPVHLVGLAAASANGACAKPAADWCRFAIRRQEGRWRMSALRRRYHPETGGLADETGFELTCG